MHKECVELVWTKDLVTSRLLKVKVAAWSVFTYIPVISDESIIVAVDTLFLLRLLSFEVQPSLGLTGFCGGGLCCLVYQSVDNCVWVTCQLAIVSLCRLSGLSTSYTMCASNPIVLFWYTKRKAKYILHTKEPEFSFSSRYYVMLCSVLHMMCEHPCVMECHGVCIHRPDRQMWVLSHHHHHHHQSLNRKGCWGTTDDFATSFLHFPLFFTALWDFANSRPVHSLMSSSHLFLCLPCLLPLFTVPCKMVLDRPDEQETWPYHCSLHLFAMVLLDLGMDFLVGNMVFVWDV